MKKFSEKYLKNLPTTPKTETSPDFEGSKKIRSTRIFEKSDLKNSKLTSQPSYDNIEACTPSKTWNASYHQSRTNVSKTHNFMDQVNSHSHCCQTASQINNELNKILSLIASSEKISYPNSCEQSPDKYRIRQQLIKVQKENKRLVEFARQYQSRISKSNTCLHAKRAIQLEKQIQIIRNQLNSAIQQCNEEYQALYKTNQTLSSRLHSLQDKNSLLQKQGESLRYLLKQKEEEALRKSEQTRRKNNDKVSLSIIRQQYTESIKMLGESTALKVEDVNTQNNLKFQQIQKTISKLGSRLNNADKKMSELSLISQNLKKKGQTEDFQKKLLEKQSMIKQMQIKLQRFQEQKEHIISQQNLQTQARIRKLIENYDHQIRILKNDNLMLKQQQQNNHQEISRLISEIKYIERVKQQEIERMRANMNSKVKEEYQKQNRKLNQKIGSLEDQIIILKANQIDLNQDLHGLKQKSVSRSEYLDLQAQKNDIQEYLNSQKQQNLILSQKIEQLTISHQQIQKAKKHQEEIQSILIQKQNKINQLEMTIYNITKILEEMEEKVSHLEDNKMKTLKRQNQSRKELRNLEQLLQKERSQKKQEIQNIRIQMYRDIQKQLREQIQKDIGLELVQKYSKCNKDLKDELLQLKELVCQGKFERLETQLEKISQLYNNELLKAQQNRYENQKLERALLENEEKLSEIERINIILTQKVKILETNKSLLDNQLQKKKQSYTQLLNQKSILEKQFNALKQVRLDRQSIEATKAKAKQISLKIEKLLNLEESRIMSTIKFVENCDVNTQ